MGKHSKTGDPSCLLYAVIDKSGTMWVEDCQLRNRPVDQLEECAIGFIAAASPDVVVAETNGFQEVLAANIAQKCASKGIPCPLLPITSTFDKQVRIRQDVGPLLHQKRIRIRNTPDNRLGLMQMREFPSGKHDDYPDAISLITQAINHIYYGRKQGPKEVLRTR